MWNRLLILYKKYEDVSTIATEIIRLRLKKRMSKLEFNCCVNCVNIFFAQQIVTSVTPVIPIYRLKPDKLLCTNLFPNKICVNINF